MNAIPSPLRILIDVPINESGLAQLKLIPGLQLSFTDPPEERVRHLPEELLRDQHILFCMFPPENHQDLKSLQFIQISSSGYTQLAPLNLAKRAIPAANALGVFDVPIGEWNIAMMVNMARNLKGMIENQQAGIWDRSARFQREIRGATVGFWGYGGIGRETARLCQTFGMKVHVMTRSGVGPRHNIYRVSATGDPEGELPDRVFRQEEKAAFLPELDFLIVALPLNAQTEGIIGEEELRMLPAHAFVLNPARGPLIQEAALLRALRENWIAGAALDTHYAYPLPADHPLWSMPNVILTPHISGSSLSQHYLRRVWEIFVENVRRLVRGDALLNLLSREQLAALS